MEDITEANYWLKIRGAKWHAIYHYGKANNKYMKDYDKKNHFI